MMLASYEVVGIQAFSVISLLTLLNSERPKLHTILAFLSAIGLFIPWQKFSTCHQAAVSLPHPLAFLNGHLPLH